MAQDLRLYQLWLSLGPCGTPLSNCMSSMVQACIHRDLLTEGIFMLLHPVLHVDEEVQLALSPTLENWTLIPCLQKMCLQPPVQVYTGGHDTTYVAEQVCHKGISPM